MTQAAGPVPRDGGVIDARWAVSGLFIANGILMGSWAPKLPVLMQRLQITESVAGLLVLVLGLGAVSMMPAAVVDLPFFLLISRKYVRIRRRPLSSS